MEADARPPQKLSTAGNLAANWNRFKKEFQTYMKITKGHEKPEEEQVAWLLNFIGPNGLKAFEKITFNDPEDEKKMAIVLEKLDEIFNPPKNVIEERFKFFSRAKKVNESLDTYILELAEMSKSCEFGDQSESLIRDTVILNIRDKHLRTLLFEEKHLSWEKFKLIYRTYEINSEKIKDASKEILIKKTEPEPKTAEPPSRRPRSTSRRPMPSRQGPKSERKGCWKCGKCHPMGACPAYKKECVYCKKLNHFSHCCPIAKLDKVEINNANSEPPGNKNPLNSTENVSEATPKNEFSPSGDGKKSVPHQTPQYRVKPSAPSLLDLTFDTNVPHQISTQYRMRPSARTLSILEPTSDPVPPSLHSVYPNLANEIPASTARQLWKTKLSETNKFH